MLRLCESSDRQPTVVPEIRINANRIATGSSAQAADNSRLSPRFQIGTALAEKYGRKPAMQLRRKIGRSAVSNSFAIAIILRLPP
jgi:hypothetical protein